MSALNLHKRRWLLCLSAGLWLCAHIAQANPPSNPLASPQSAEPSTSALREAPEEVSGNAIGTFEHVAPHEALAPVEPAAAATQATDNTVNASAPLESATDAIAATPLESNVTPESNVTLEPAPTLATEKNGDVPPTPAQPAVPASPVQAVTTSADPAPVTQALPNAVTNQSVPMTEKSSNEVVAKPAVSPTTAPLKDKPFRFSSQPANLTENPYKLLVSLAFGTKNSLGIRTYEEAHQHFCLQARDTEDANAQFAMGWLYAMGKGVTVNHDIASYFFSKSAAQGNRDAKLWLDRQQGDPELADLPDCMTKPPPMPVIVVQTPEVAPDSTLKITEDFFDEPKAFPRGPIYALVSKHAPAYDIDVDFAMAVIAVESAFNPKAKSPKNAQGLMQLMPETQVRFNVKDPYNPEQNIKGGLSYLRWLLNFFKGDVELVAAAYNAGEKNVLKYRGIPPFQETRDYVKKISVYYKKKFHAYTVDGQRILDKKNAK